MAAGQGFVAVVGARVLPEACAPQVSAAVGFLLGRGWGIGSGGARGADAYALGALVAAGGAACARSVVFLPGAVPAQDRTLQAFVAHGGRVVPGPGRGRLALLARSRRLAREAAGVVAFLWGPSRGSVFTARATRWAARSVIRRPPQLGQNPRPLHELSRACDSCCCLELKTIWSFSREVRWRPA